MFHDDIITSSFRGLLRRNGGFVRTSLPNDYLPGSRHDVFYLTYKDNFNILNVIVLYVQNMTYILVVHPCPLEYFFNYRSGSTAVRRLGSSWHPQALLLSLVFSVSFAEFPGGFSLVRKGRIV